MTDTPPTGDNPPAPQQPPQNTPPAPDPSAQHWQSQYDQAQVQIQQLQTQIQQQQTPAPQTQAQPQQTAQPDYNNWSSWKDSEGNYKPEYVDSVFHPDLPQEVRNTMLNTIDGINSYAQQQIQQSVASQFGSQENFDTALSWAQANLPEYERHAMNTALQNTALVDTALQSLKAKAEAGGAFTQQPQTNEPPSIPDGTTQVVGDTPLVPGSKEAIAAVQDPRYNQDTQYTEQTQRRIRAGSTGNPNFPSTI